jgi:hypothetical protein
MQANREKAVVDNTYKPPAPLGSTPRPPAWADGRGHGTLRGTDTGMMHVTPVFPDTWEGVTVGCSLRAAAHGQPSTPCIHDATHMHVQV